MGVLMLAYYVRTLITCYDMLGEEKLCMNVLDLIADRKE